jgi:hypothetical protein
MSSVEAAGGKSWRKDDGVKRDVVISIVPIGREWPDDWSESLILSTG